MSRQTNSAIIIGSGIAGLLSATVLSRHFDKVLILEKDPAVDLDKPNYSGRKGLPQAHHQHILLMKGREIFESLFPGFDEELAELGAPLLSYSNDVELYVGKNKLPRFPSALKIRPCRRPLIDWVIRKRLSQYENIDTISQCRVTRLLADETKQRITGVMTKQHNTELALHADLVVECSGRGSRLPKWLHELNALDVPSTEVDPKLGYASRLYEIPVEHKEDVRSIEVAPHAPDNPRAAGLWLVENDQWLLTLIGMAGKYPENDEAGFLEFATKLSTPEVANTIKKAKAISPISSYKGTRNIWRHYDRVDQYPDGLLVLGDAMCAFNPLHGQGLTLIGMTTEVLEQHIQQGISENFSAKWSRKLYKRFNRVFLSAWMFAISEDMRWPQTEGRQVDWRLKLAYLYTDNLLATCPNSKTVTETCLSVANMMSSPLSLFHPKIILRMLWHRLRPNFRSKQRNIASTENETFNSPSQKQSQS
jgi:2-polyprenyl-6-methoxyphenol hydroxylase-like FAD-dependent oxidoreductase